MPRTARAQDDFHRYINAVVQLYNSGESERALEQLQRARQRAREIEQDVLVSLYEGLIFMDLGEREQALAAFETGLLLDPAAKLPTKVSPKVSDAFEAVRKHVRKKLARGAEQRRPPQTEKAPMTPHSTPPVWLSDKLASNEAQPPATKTEQPVGPPAEPKLEPSAPPAPKLFDPKPEVVEQARTRVPVAPLVLAGVGVTAAGVGAVFGMQSRSKAAGVRDAYRGGLPPSTDTARLGGLLDDARSDARRANVMFGTAALSVGGAIVTWLLASDASPEESRGGR